MGMATGPGRTSLLGLLTLMLGVGVAAYGQSQTGQISGFVVDQTGAAILGAKIQLVHALTKNTREFVSEGNGSFVFPNLLAGTYSLAIEQSGFQTYRQDDIAVSPAERVDLHQIKLAIGDVKSAVLVTAEAARVQTSSSERAGLISSTQVETIPNRGRDYLGLLRVLPGVVETSDRNAPGDAGAPQVNGGQAGQFLVTLDGVPNQDVGATQNSGFITPNVDAIAEVKVMLSGSQAEFGARSGGQMSVTIKSGNRDFHGSGYYFWRHEMFNANARNNNRQGIAKPPYRFRNLGYTIGGPVLIPGTDFNRERSKLFFFFAHDILRRTISQVSNLTFPTEAERSGDFSESYDSVTNRIISLKDPTTGPSAPGQHIASVFVESGRPGVAEAVPLAEHH